MDVIDIDGRILKRPTERGCIVCGAPGRACAAGRLHSALELQEVTTKIFTDYFAQADSEKLSALAVQSLIDEVNTTPKPGLVDRRNNGSHHDMNISTFLKSAATLEPYFQNCVKIGQQTAAQTPEETFAHLRVAGLSAEKEMYTATGGVNTHKGIIYTLGILCGALGRLWKPEAPIAPFFRLFDECAQMVKFSVTSDIAAFDGSTAGQRLYLNQGIPGIRGEVAAGLPSVKNISLPAYQNGLRAGLSANDAGATALLPLIAEIKDTNLYHRGGVEGAAFATNAARTLLLENEFPSMEQVETLDDSFIAKNLSPGGCADLLAVTYFVCGLMSYH
jgi:holo-ACP synthase/triphosphoribosyl-dephospho-CoA synthase